MERSTADWGGAGSGGGGEAAGGPAHRAGQKIRAWRKGRGLSAQQLGELIDPARVVPPQTVYSWETTGRMARGPIMLRLQALGICEPGDWLTPPAAQAA